MTLPGPTPRYRDPKYGYSIFVDEPAIENEVLDLNRYINILSTLILESEPQFSIGIFGNWGTGKTTLLKNIEKVLSSDGCNCLFFNAWKYDQEPDHISIPLIVSMLLRIYDKNKGAINRWKKTRAYTQTFKERLVQVVSGLSVKMKFGIPNTAELEVGYDGSKPFTFAISNLFNFSRRLNRYQSFRQHYNTTKIFDGIDLIQELVDEDRVVEGFGRDKKLKLVVFIDDLDRCNPEKAVQIFELIKVFFDIPGIVFVLALSNKIIELALQEKYGQTNTEFKGSDYIKKIIQLPINIPPWKSYDIVRYIQMLFSDYDNETIKTVFRNNIELISECVEPNPREVKRFLNHFILLYKLYELNKIPESADLILIQALQLRWYWFFEAILADKSFLYNLKDYLSSNQMPDQLEPELAKKILNEKPLIDLLKGHGKRIFEISFEQWASRKIFSQFIAFPYDNGKTISTNETNDLINNFVMLNPIKQEEAWTKLINDKNAVQNFAYSLGRQDFKNFSKQIQNRIWGHTSENLEFATGFASSLGDHYMHLEQEMREKVWETIKKNTAMSNTFGYSITKSLLLGFYSGLDENTKERILNEGKTNEEFAEGLVRAFGQGFSRLNHNYRTYVFDLIEKSDRLAMSLSSSLDTTSLNNMDKLLWDIVWNLNQRFESFSKGLAKSLAETFSLLKSEIQDMIWNEAEGDQKFGGKFGYILAENYSLLDKTVRPRFWKEVKINPSFGNSALLCFGKNYGILDSETQQSVQNIARSDKQFQKALNDGSKLKDKFNE